MCRNWTGHRLLRNVTQCSLFGKQVGNFLKSSVYIPTTPQRKIYPRPWTMSLHTGAHGWSQECYLRKPLSGDSFSAHQLGSGWTKGGTSIPWNIQWLKGKKPYSIYYKTDESQKHDFTWKKTDVKEYIWHNSLYKKISRKGTFIVTESRSAFAQGRRGERDLVQANLMQHCVVVF